MLVRVPPTMEANMKSFVSTAILGAAGLLALSLSAHAAGSTSVTDIAVIKSLKSTQYMLARGADSVPGGGGLYKKPKKSKKKPKK
jgi:hypothetical protein